MKIKFLLPFFMIILTGLACQFGAPPVDTEATVAAAIQATKDAEPTATLTPSPTPTETVPPTETPLPTETPAPTDAPTITPLPTGAVTSEAALENWTRYDFLADGFSISLPNSWEQFTADPETMNSIIEAAGTNNENLEGLMSNQFMQTLVQEGLRMMALDTSSESLTSELPNNFNILTGELPFTITLDLLIDATLAQLEQLFTPTTPIEHERIVLGPDQLEAERLSYTIEQVSFSGQTISTNLVQYIILDGKTQYVLTFTGVSSDTETLQAVFEQIAQTFELIEP